jgi:hypothetical protein
MRTLTIAAIVMMAVTPALAGGQFGQWRAPSPQVSSPAGSSAQYNPSVNGTAGSGQATVTEGGAISSRTGLENAGLNMSQITSSGQASPHGTPGH